LSAEFTGAFRLFMKSEGKLYEGNLLLREGKIIASSLTNIDDKTEITKEESLDEIKRKIPASAGDLDVYSFTDVDMRLSIDKNLYALMETEIELPSFIGDVSIERKKKEEELKRLEEEERVRLEEEASMRAELRKRLEEERKRREEEERKKKEEEERKRREEETRNKFKAKIKGWESLGYDTTPLIGVITEDLKMIEGEFKKFEENVQRLQKLEKRLNSLDTGGFEAQARVIISKLKDMRKTSEVEKDISALEKDIEKRKKEEEKRKKKEEEERKKKEEEERKKKEERKRREEETRNKFKAKIKEWESLGYDTGPLKSIITKDLKTVNKGFKKFEFDIKVLQRIEKQLKSLDTGGLEDKVKAIEPKLKDTKKIVELMSDIERLKRDVRSRKDRKKKEDRKEEEKKCREEETRNKFKAKIKEWESKGYDVVPLTDIISKDLKAIEKGFKKFERDVQELQKLEKRLNSLDTRGLEAQAKSIASKLKNTGNIPKIKDAIYILEETIKERKAEEEVKKKEHISKKQAFENLLRNLEISVKNIRGLAVITKNGLPIAVKLPRDVNLETFSGMSAAMYGAAETAMIELRRGHMYWVYTETEDCTFVAVDAGPLALLVALIGAGANIGLVLMNLKIAANKVKNLM